MPRIAVLSLLFALLLGAGAGAQSGYPHHRELEVNDFAGVLSAGEAERLRGLLRDLRQRTGIEATVVTIGSIGDYRTGDRSVESFATGLFNAWGVGDAGRDDGVMVLVAVEDRKVRIEVGSGYGSSEDRAMQAVIDSAMLPHFRRGDYGRGIVQGTETVVAHFGRTPSAPGASPPAEAPSASAVAPPPSSARPGAVEPTSERRGVLGWLLGLAAAGLGGGGLWLARRPPRCRRCGNPMAPMDERLDDAHLDQGQRLEESVGSIDHVVYQCPGCGQIEPRRRRKWFSGFDACPGCGYRTAKSRSQVVRQPTYSSTGSKKVETTCRHCGRHHVDYVVVPMLTRSSSSGSSFGGGSSSGGGASGSW